ncbi:9567_t:CDS:1 [Ambispora gerdemannii]|uniref:9567_t:CDS:1 n=1 Tax=Ambispora gerdemannii TaxID=144530 RepID=A0A9N9H3B4_9GLOM|nr:9567_t:CDS:1 [Ambispora gerdemannii]
MVVYAPSKGTEERTRLYQDYKEEFSELRRVYGIRHLTSKKEERQNNPEIELNEAQFIALERDKKREREKSIKEFERFCQGQHILTYGTSFEQRAEKVLEVKEIEEMKEEPNIKETPEQLQVIAKK